MLHTASTTLQVSSTSPVAKTSYVKIPASDLTWVNTQKLSVIQLFLDAWASDPYGSRYVKLHHNLRPTAFRLARKLLTEQGLFIFKRDVSVIDPRVTNCWLVKNLHGARCTWQDNPAHVLEDDVIALEDNAPTLTSVAPAPPILPQPVVEPALPEASLTLHNFSNQQYSGAQIVVAKEDEMKIEDDNDSQPTREETRETLTQLREMGLRLNPTLQRLVLQYYSRVPNAIAHIKERQASGERFKNLEGAFVNAVKHSAQPQCSHPSWGYHAEVKPPSLEQLAALDAAETSGLIRDYYLSSDNVCKVVQLSFDLIPWWEYLSKAGCAVESCAELDI